MRLAAAWKVPLGMDVRMLGLRGAEKCCAARVLIILRTRGITIGYMKARGGLR
jgi:hypothetical protein